MPVFYTPNFNFQTTSLIFTKFGMGVMLLPSDKHSKAAFCMAGFCVSEL
jgi:hypothetical protein